jgi:hypothetical protein
LSTSYNPTPIGHPREAVSFPCLLPPPTAAALREGGARKGGLAAAGVILLFLACVIGVPAGRRGDGNDARGLRAEPFALSNAELNTAGATEECRAARKREAVRIAKASWSGQLKVDEEGVLTHYTRVSRETFPLLLLRVLDPEPNTKVFLDVGAHKGWISQRLHTYFTSTHGDELLSPTIYAFEPVRQNFETV